MAMTLPPEQSAMVTRILRSYDPILGLKHFGPPETDQERRELADAIRALTVADWRRYEGAFGQADPGAASS